MMYEMMSRVIKIWYPSIVCLFWAAASAETMRDGHIAHDGAACMSSQIEAQEESESIVVKVELLQSAKHKKFQIDTIAKTRNGAISRKKMNHESVHVNASSQPYSAHLTGTIWPATSVMSDWIFKEIEYELVFQSMSEPPVRSKALMALFEIVFVFLAFCGVDRCYMGQPLLGLLKGCSCGGCGIWFLIDLLAITVNVLLKAPSINSAGFFATWDPDTIGTAVTLGIIFLPLYACCCCFCGVKYGTTIKAMVRSNK